MKQHYNKCIGAVLALLLIAAYFVNVSKKTDSEVAGKPKAPATQTKGGPAGGPAGSPAGSPAAPADEKTMASIQQSLAKREYNISFDNEKKEIGRAHV